MLASICSMRFCTLALVKFRSRLFTALNLLPSTATTASREQVQLTAEHNELPACTANGRPIVLAEIGDRFEVRHQSAGQPHQFDIALGLTLQPSARLDAIEVAVEIDLQHGRWMIAWPACRLRAASRQNPAWSDRALQRKHRSLEPDCPRLRNLPGGRVRRCPACVPRIARNDSSRHSRHGHAAILARPSVTESRVFTQPGSEAASAGALSTFAFLAGGTAKPAPENLKPTPAGDGAGQRLVQVPHDLLHPRPQADVSPAHRNHFGHQ